MGLRLREIRNRRGLSPQQMCARLGVKADRYRKWENGTNGIPLDYAVEVCEILRCSLDELLGRVIPALSSDEQLLLDLYRSTDARGKAAIMRTAEGEAGVEGPSAGDLNAQAS